MLLVDGVKYEEWIPSSEEKFESLVKEHSSEIFGDNSIYIDLKHKMKSNAGVGSIPDGYVIILGDSPSWHIVEVELSSHPLYEHIVPQVKKFYTGIKNPYTQKDITEMIFREIESNSELKLKFEKISGTTQSYKYLSDLISKPPILTVIIEKDTEVLREVIEPDSKVVEFRTFIRENSDLSVHVHLFEPIYDSTSLQKTDTCYSTFTLPSCTYNHIAAKSKRVTFSELINAGLLKDGQVLIFYHTRLYNDECAYVVASENKLRYQLDNRLYTKTELAEQLSIKHGYKKTAMRGPKFWKTEDNVLLIDLEEQVRKQKCDKI